MDGSVVQRVGAFGYAQEARALAVGLLADALDLFQLGARLEALFAPVIADALRGFGVDAGDVRQQRGRGGIQIGANRRNTAFDHAGQRRVQLFGVHIVLVLAHADGFGVDLDQLGQRVLQAPRNRNRAAQRHVQPGQFLRGQRRRGIDRRARLVGHHIGDGTVLLAQQLGGEDFAFLRGGAISDG